MAHQLALAAARICCFRYVYECMVANLSALDLGGSIWFSFPVHASVDEAAGHARRTAAARAGRPGLTVAT